VSVTFADESMHGRSVRIICAPIYDEYFDWNIFAIWSEV